MPKGVYERTPEQKAILRERFRKAAKFERTPEQKAILRERIIYYSRNRTKEQKDALRTRLASYRETPQFKKSAAANQRIGAFRIAARAIIRHCPLGAKPGDTFKSGRRLLAVVDPAPVKVSDTLWRQDFSQTVVYYVFGRKITIQGIARITWNYQPTNANVLTAPNLENVITSELDVLTREQKSVQTPM